MNLTVGSRIVASVDVTTVQLTPILGAFELVISLTGHVYGMSDGIHRSLTIGSARVLMRSKSGQPVQLGRAVPDSLIVIRQANNSNHLNFALKLILHPHQLEKLEAERNGGDLNLSLALLARASASNNEGGDWEEPLGESPIIVPKSTWVARLNESNAGRRLLLEIRLPEGTMRHPAERHLLRAQELFAEGAWRNCVSECRQFAEELGGTRLGAAKEMLKNEGRAMTKEEREALIIASLRHYAHMAAHSESKNGALDYSRSEAKLALSVAASLAEHHFGLL